MSLIKKKLKYKIKAHESIEREKKDKKTLKVIRNS